MPPPPAAKRAPSTDWGSPWRKNQPTKAETNRLADADQPRPLQHASHLVAPRIAVSVAYQLADAERLADVIDEDGERDHEAKSRLNRGTSSDADTLE